MKSSILVIGDSCEDVFIYGKAERLCPDAPVPVFVAQEIKRNGGMAANVYNNLVAMSSYYSNNNSLTCDLLTNKKTIVKTRYVDKRTNQMLLRVDSGEEHIERCSLDDVNWNQYGAVVVSDYNKGFLLEADIEKIVESHPVVFLDTKKLLKPWYLKVPYIKINEHEFEKTKHLLSTKNNLIITLGSNGCEYQGKRFEVEKVDIKDTVGAGDTFLAALACSYVHANCNIETAIKQANKWATLAVQVKGVYVPDGK